MNYIAAAVAFFNEQLEQQARQLSRISQQEAEQERKRRHRREIYQQYAAPYVGQSDLTCDQLVVRQLFTELLAGRDGQELSNDEIGKVGRVLLQGPVARQLKQTEGKAAAIEYAKVVLAKAQKVVEREQRRYLDRGMEL